MIGTSGYSYSDWKGIFYPRDLPADRYLEYYSKTFPFVELNFTYYRQPEPEQTERFLGKTGEEFIFTVKAHKSLTHERTENWKKDAGDFIEGIKPLAVSDRLGSIVLQFPYSFRYTKENRLYLAGLCDFLKNSLHRSPTLTIEFRSREWNNPKVIEGLLRRNIGWINSDNPDLPGLPSGEMTATSGIGYIRFHGRNRDNWWNGTNVSRYDYRYTSEELREKAEEIKKFAGEVRKLFIAFNNHHKGQAVENALELTRLIK